VPLIFPLLAFLLFVVILLQKGIEVSGVPRASEVQLTQEDVQATFLAHASRCVREDNRSHENDGSPSARPLETRNERQEVIRL
jgi:hypothetical protein